MTRVESRATLSQSRGAVPLRRIRRSSVPPLLRPPRAPRISGRAARLAHALVAFLAAMPAGGEDRGSPSGARTTSRRACARARTVKRKYDAAATAPDSLPSAMESALMMVDVVSLGSITSSIMPLPRHVDIDQSAVGVDQLRLLAAGSSASSTGSRNDLHGPRCPSPRSPRSARRRSGRARRRGRS